MQKPVPGGSPEEKKMQHQNSKIAVEKKKKSTFGKDSSLIDEVSMTALALSEALQMGLARQVTTL